MNNPMLIWYAIVAILLLLFLLQFILYLRHHSRHNGHHHKAIFGCGKEREMFYIPGDRMYYNDCDDDDDEI